MAVDLVSIALLQGWLPTAGNLYHICFIQDFSWRKSLALVKVVRVRHNLYNRRCAFGDTSHAEDQHLDCNTSNVSRLSADFYILVWTCHLHLVALIKTRETLLCSLGSFSWDKGNNAQHWVSSVDTVSQNIKRLKQYTTTDRRRTQGSFVCPTNSRHAWRNSVLWDLCTCRHSSFSRWERIIKTNIRTLVNIVKRKSFTVN